MSFIRTRYAPWTIAGLLVLALLGSRCAPSAPKRAERGPAGGGQSDLAQAAMKTYVAPGDLDEYYFFASGGHSGQVYIYGVPSMRHLSTIPSSRRTPPRATVSTTSRRRCSGT